MSSKDDYKVMNVSYKTLELVFDISSYNILYFIDVSYDSVCSYENDSDYDCDHDYSRCQVLKNIEIGRFDAQSFIKESIVQSFSREQLDAKLIEVDLKEFQFFENLQESFSFCSIDYVDAEGVGDYYGEVLEKNIFSHGSLVEEIRDKLVSYGFSVQVS